MSQRQQPLEQSDAQKKRSIPWLEKKLIVPELIETWAEQTRSSGRTIGTLNGSFDLLHAGHLYIIHQASLQADCLLVALNSD